MKTVSFILNDTGDTATPETDKTRLSMGAPGDGGGSKRLRKATAEGYPTKVVQVFLPS